METREQFGPLVVDYSQVQTKINMKYDTWHKEILSRFGKIGVLCYVTWGSVTSREGEWRLNFRSICHGPRESFLFVISLKITITFSVKNSWNVSMFYPKNETPCRADAGREHGRFPDWDQQSTYRPGVLLPGHVKHGWSSAVCHVRAAVKEKYETVAGARGGEKFWRAYHVIGVLPQK